MAWCVGTIITASVYYISAAVNPSFYIMSEVGIAKRCYNFLTQSSFGLYQLNKQNNGQNLKKE